MEMFSERLTCYASHGIDSRKKTILFASDMAGTAEALGPVISRIDEDNKYNWIALADKKSVGVLDRFKLWRYPRSVDYLTAIPEFNPALVVSGPSQVGPEPGRFLTRKAIRYGIPVMWLLDSPGGIKAQHLTRLNEYFGYPDFFCVSDQETKRFVELSAPMVDPSDIKVTGQPAFDSLLSVKQDEAVLRSGVRGFLDIASEEEVLLFAGQIQGTKETLVSLLGALNTIAKPPALIARFHPTRDTNIADYPPILASYKGRVVDSSIIKRTEDLVPGVDIVASMFSTVNMTGIYLRKPVLYLLYEDLARKACLHDYQIEPEELPIVRGNAALGIYQKDDLFPCLEKLLKDRKLRDEMQLMQEILYPLDGKSAERVAQVIEDILEL